MRKTVPFENVYMHATLEAGITSSAVDKRADVTFIESDTGGSSLVQVRAGGLCVYMNVATARSLAAQIMRVTDDGDLLWETEPITGEEVDRWTEDIRAGAIGGDPA